MYTFIFLVSFPWSCLHRQRCHSIFSFVFPTFFFLNEVFLTILYFWWYCVFIYSKCRQLKEVIPLNVLKLLVTGEGRGFCLVSHHWGHGAHNNSRTGYVKQCTERQTRSVLMLCWFSCSDLFYQVWLVTLKVLSFYFFIFNSTMSYSEGDNINYISFKEIPLNKKIKIKNKSCKKML